MNKLAVLPLPHDYNPRYFNDPYPNAVAILEYANTQIHAPNTEHYAIMAFLQSGTVKYTVYIFKTSAVNFPYGTVLDYSGNKKIWGRPPYGYAVVTRNSEGQWSWNSYTRWTDPNNVNALELANVIGKPNETDKLSYYSNVMFTTNAGEYPSTLPEADFTVAKNVGEYSINLVVRATTRSDVEHYQYRTKAYTVGVSWKSPLTDTEFNIMLSGLPEHIPTYTFNPNDLPTGVSLPTYNYNYKTETGVYMRGVRTPMGAFSGIPPTAWDELTDVPAIRVLPLTELLKLAQQQTANVKNDDLFAVMLFTFYYNDEITYQASLDYSSLFGEDIDISGGTISDPNAADSVNDTNVYSDSVALTVPTLTATGVFNRCYTLDGNSVNDLCDFLYNADDTIFNEIIDGVLTRGNPIESIIDLRLYPFDVRAFTGGGTAQKIKFGRTDTGVVGSKLPHNANAVISLGSCVIPRVYNNFLDYQMGVSLYIPFCGVVELPIDRTLNHTISVKLIVDYVTGACTAVVYVDALPLLYQSGVIGVSIPLTATNSADFAKSIIGNLITGAAQIAGGNVGGAAMTATETAIDLYTGSKLQTAGASSPQTSLFQPKNAYVLLSIVNPPAGVYDDVYAENIGYACFMPVSSIGIMNGAGFTAFDNVKLNIPQATEQEKAEILTLLMNGVYM